MNYDFPQLFRDHAVPHWTEGKNVSPGWTNVNCIYCDDPSNHLGFSPEGACVCWRCGNHSTADAVHLLTGQDWDRIKASYCSIVGGVGSPTDFIPPSSLSLPIGTMPLNPEQRRYLIGRGFDPDHLANEYGIQGTGILGEYKFRIIVPIYRNEKLISFLGRDYTGMSPLRYKACRREMEVIHHKHSLYNIDRADKDVVAVEGVTDVWRMGRGTVGTFGVGFTQEQVVALSRFRRVFIMYDPDAEERAEMLARAVSGLGPEVEIIDLDGGMDPAELSDNEAKNIMKELGI